MKAVQYGVVKGRFRYSNEYKDGIELEYLTKINRTLLIQNISRSMFSVLHKFEKLVNSKKTSSLTDVLSIKLRKLAGTVPSWTRSCMSETEMMKSKRGREGLRHHR